MPMIEFTALSAQFFTGVGELQRGVPCLSFRIQPARGESLSLVTGEKQIQGMVTLVSREATEATSDSVGVVHYYPAIHDVDVRAEAKYIVQATLSSEQIRELLECARLGLLPTSITVDAEAMKFSSHGRGIVWDNVKYPKLRLISINVAVPLAGDQDNTLDSVEPLLPAIRDHLSEVTRQLQKTNAALKQAVTTAIVLLLGAAAIIWILK